MNQTRFLYSGNNFNVPTRGRAHPLQKRSGIARISQSAGSNDTHRVRPRILYRTMKPPQDLHRGGNRIRRQKTAAEYGFAQARDLAVLMDLDEPVADEASNFQADGVRSDINRGKSRHGGRPTVYRRSVEDRKS